MLEIPKDHMLLLIGRYLEEVEEGKLASKVFKRLDQEALEGRGNPLLKKKLQSIVRNYVSTHQKLLDYYLQEVEQQPQEEEQIPQVPAKKVQLYSHVVFKKKQTQEEQKAHDSFQLSGTKLAGFSKPKLLETTVIDHLEIVEFDSHGEPRNGAKEKRKDKKKREVVKEEEVEEEIEEEAAPQPEPEPEPQPVKKQKKKPRKASKQSSQDQQPKQKKSLKPARLPRQPLKCSTMSKQQLLASVVQTLKPQPGEKRFFSRIDNNEIGELPEHLRDNTFEAKFKYGAGDEWGKYGHEKLKDTRGESFKKTKGKLKNKAFQASGIDIHKINSIKLV